MKVVALIQARMKSTRLPGKILKKINNKTLIEILIGRLKHCKAIDKIIIATSTDQSNDILTDLVSSLGVEVYRGSEDDVLDRFYNALANQSFDYVVRITSDCPLIDPALVDNVIEFTINSDVDYGSNCAINNEQFPDGQDIEVFKYQALKKTWEIAQLPSEREHVTPFIRKNINVLFSSIFYDNEINYGHIRMTVDTQEDLDAIYVLVKDLGDNKNWLDYTNYIISNPKKFHNQNIIRNEGFQKSLLNDKKNKNG